MKDIEDTLKEIDGLSERPFITERFGDNWKEFAIELNKELLINIAWKQGRKVILLEKFIKENLGKTSNKEE